MGEPGRTWLGWPLWLVSALLVVAAVTGSAGPVEVIWVLGTVSVALSIAWWHLRGWLRGPRRGDHPAGRADTPRPPLEEGHDSRGTDAGPGAAPRDIARNAPGAGG